MSISCNEYIWRREPPENTSLHNRLRDPDFPDLGRRCFQAFQKAAATLIAEDSVAQCPATKSRSDKAGAHQRRNCGPWISEFLGESLRGVELPLIAAPTAGDMGHELALGYQVSNSRQYWRS